MTTATQKIPSGYKQTEIGIIPADWDVKRLGDIVQFNNGKAHERFIDDKGNYIVVNSKFISTAGEVFKTSGENLSPLSAGDIAMVMSDIPNGKALAKCFFVEKNGKYTLNQRICAFKSNGADSLYLFYKLNRNKYFLDFDSGVGQTNLKKSEVLDCPVALPADKNEQSSIAVALSVADTLIKKLENLIEKKKNTKQGVMQELLTGKKRLPGFVRKWELKIIDELFSISGGYSASREELSDDGFCYLHYGDIHKSNKTYIDVSAEYADIPKLNIPINCVSKTSLLKDGDIVFVDASEDDEGASKHIVIRNPQNIDYISGLHTIVLKSKDESLDVVYKQYCFQTKDVKKQFKFYSVGTKVTGISKTNITKIQIPIPHKNEQVAIANILSNMDAEIRALETKLKKYKMIKEGMMPLLLTGKTRLMK